MGAFSALVLVAAILLAALAYVAARRTLARSVDWVAHDKLFGWDKLDHFAWSLGLFVALAAVHMPPTRAWILFLLAAVGVEVVELARFSSWLERGGPSPRPEICDALSWKDMLWDVAGALAGAWCVRMIS